MLIDVKISHKGVLMASCNYLVLINKANSFVREIKFHSIQKTHYFDEIIDALYFEKIEIEVWVNSPYHGPYEYGFFEILIFDDNCSSKDYWMVKGEIFLNHERATGYYQPTIDVLHCWENHISCNDRWFTSKATSDFKQGYLETCFVYSGIRKHILQKNNYQIDWRIIKDEYDFIFLMSEAILGEKSYLGKDIRTLQDCFYMIEKSGVSFKGKEMIFIGEVRHYKLRKIYDEMNAYLNSKGFIVTNRPA